jgi:N-acetylglucosamine kinase-like BadF-type ATPase
VKTACLGVDVGGSGVRAAAASADGRVLGVIEALGLEQAIGPLIASVGPARWMVYVGLAGISRRGRRARILRSLEKLVPAAGVQVTSDAEVALWGALPDGEGIAVVAGTGSIALARAYDGRQARAGGHGYLLGDEGSAFWLGREAVRAALAAAEGRGPPTCLADLAARRPVNPNELARLAPQVSQAAADGDAVARHILAQAGAALSQLTVAAARGVWPDGPPEPVKVATCGGGWQAGHVLLDPFRAALLHDLPVAQVVQPQLPPVGGALLLACRRASPLAEDPAPWIRATLTR